MIGLESVKIPEYRNYSELKGKKVSEIIGEIVNNGSLKKVTISGMCRMYGRFFTVDFVAENARNLKNGAYGEELKALGNVEARSIYEGFDWVTIIISVDAPDFKWC